MKYSILNLYHPLSIYSEEENLAKAQADCLSDWCRKLNNLKMAPILEPKVKFSIYKLYDYPDQEKMRKFIYDTYVNKNGDLYWAGNKYINFEQLYSELSKQKSVVELIIED